MRSIGVVAALVVSTAVSAGTANAADEWEKSPVYAKWQALGGASFAGEKVGDEVIEPGGHTRWAKFSKYDIVITWGEDAGAHWMSGGISRKWMSAAGTFRAVATTDQVPVNRGSQAGAVVEFGKNSSIYYSDAYGAFGINGPERELFVSQGGVTGTFGWPSSDLLQLGWRGWEQQFSEAVSTYREPERWAYWISGALRDKFREGLDAGEPDFPAASQQRETGNGWSIRTNRGAIYWSAATGAHKLETSTAITYQNNNGPRGSFGYPTTDSRAHDGGFSTEFTGNTTIYRGPDDFNAFWISGRVRDEYGMQGGPAGPLGWPRSSQTPAPDTDGQYVLFGEAGDKVIIWGPRTGGHLVRGRILEELRAGGDVAVYGLPHTGEWMQPAFTFQQFENASVFLMGAGTHTLGWDFRDIWWETGGTDSPLGMPASDAFQTQPNVFYQEFTTGWITCDYNVGECTSSATGKNARPQATKSQVTTSGPRR